MPWWNCLRWSSHHPSPPAPIKYHLLSLPGKSNCFSVKSFFFVSFILFNSLVSLDPLLKFRFSLAYIYTWIPHDPTCNFPIYSYEPFLSCYKNFEFLWNSHDYLFSGGRGGVEEWEGSSFYLKTSQFSILKYFMLTEREIFRSVLGIDKGWILIAIDPSNKSLLLTSLAACILPPVLVPSVSFSNKEFSYFHWRHFIGLPLKCVHWFCYQGDLKTRPTHL